MTTQSKMIKKTTTTNKFSQTIYLFDEEEKEFFILLLHLDNAPCYEYFLLSLKFSNNWGLYMKYKNIDRFNWLRILYLKYKKIHGGFLQDWLNKKL
jgi:hypothetical protein